MTELDHVWSQMLENARRDAETSGRADVVDYLRLRASNDAVRTTAVNWLIDSATDIASGFQSSYPLLKIEREQPYRFESGRMKLVGIAVHIEHGVRCLTVAAGWTRTPADGFMSGGALAIARLRHRGMPRSDSTLSLVALDAVPEWKIESNSTGFESSHLRSHIEVLLEIGKVG